MVRLLCQTVLVVAALAVVGVDIDMLVFFLVEIEDQA